MSIRERRVLPDGYCNKILNGKKEAGRGDDRAQCVGAPEAGAFGPVVDDEREGHHAAGIGRAAQIAHLSALMGQGNAVQFATMKKARRSNHHQSSGAPLRART